MSSSKPGSSGGRQARSGIGRYLASGVRSTHEVLAYLAARGVPAREAARLVSAYAARGILDDRACARLCADHWGRQGYAASAIRAKLAGKGLPARLIEEAVREPSRPDEEERRARALVPPGALRSPRRRMQLARKLSARGFDGELIERILGEAIPTSAYAEP